MHKHDKIWLNKFKKEQFKDDKQISSVVIIASIVAALLIWDIFLNWVI